MDILAIAKMSQCQGVTKSGKSCSRIVEGTFCWQHGDNKNTSNKNVQKTGISGNRKIGDLTLFDNPNRETWEEEYTKVMDPKYAKGTRNFSQKIEGNPWTGDGGKGGDPPIYLIPRTRGGPSYKSINLEGVSSDDVYFCPISKGYSQQDVSSFTLGPIVGEGLCLVNSAFSKAISIIHIEGGGQLDLKRKNFWRSARTPTRQINIISSEVMSVDGVHIDIKTWLRQNEDLWLEEWEKWRKHVAMCSMGDFHWSNGSPVVGYRFEEEYLDFVDWKKKCYIEPSYRLMVQDNRVINHLWAAWKEHRRPLGLVHPKSRSETAEKPITKEFLHELFNSPTEMCCQPYVVAGLLLGVPI